MDIKAASYESHLTSMGVPPEHYNLVYEKSVLIYNEEGFGKGPYNVNYIIKAVKQLYKIKDTNTFDFTGIEERVFNCFTCKDTKVRLKGLIPQKIKKEGVIVYDKCPECS